MLNVAYIYLYILFFLTEAIKALPSLPPIVEGRRRCWRSVSMATRFPSKHARDQALVPSSSRHLC